MDPKDLYRSFNQVDEALLERSEGRRPTRRRRTLGAVGALAACLCLAVIGLTAPSGTTQPATSGQPSSSDPAPVTSETYSTLPELLAYLGVNEDHAGRSDNGKGVSIAAAGQADGVIPGSTALVTSDGCYAYHLGEAEVRISRLSEGGAAPVGSIEGSGSDLFLSGELLTVISQWADGEIGLEQELSTRVRVYDISDPAAPVLREEYLQRGTLSACWMEGERLWLVTGDGVCACGWSRLEDTADYYPSLLHNGAELPWEDADISILGDPTQVRYCAVTAFEQGRVTERQAFYGDVQELFYGKGWLALCVRGRTGVRLDNPVVYTFDGTLAFTGAISPAEMLGVAPTIPLEEGRVTQGTVLTVSSVDFRAGRYRLVGTCTQAEDETTALLAVAAGPDGGDSSHALFSGDEGFPHATLTEILWEDSRAILCVSTLEDLTEVTRDCRILIADFDDGRALLRGTELSLDYHDSRVGITYGSPLGEFETLIPMGNGIYLRFSSRQTWPDGFADGFDVLKLTSDSSTLLAQEQGLSEGKYTFDFLWHVYDEDTFGVLKVSLGKEDYYRDATLSWCVFRLEGAALVLQEEIPLGSAEGAFLPGELSLLRAGETLYRVTRDDLCPTPLA